METGSRWPRKESFPFLCHPKRSTRFAFQNVRSLGPVGKEEHLLRVCQELGVAACGLADLGLRGSGQKRLEGGWLLRWEGASEIASGWQPSVGLLMSPAAAAALTDWRALSPRLLRADFAALQCTLTVLVTYAPTSQHEEEQLQHLELLDAALEAVPERNVLLVPGDFNARVGSRGSSSSLELYAGCVGPHGEDERNAAGEHLLQLCAANGLCSACTFFEHRQRYTWTSADGRTQAALDHFLVRRRRLSSVRNARVCRHRNLPTPTAKAFSDHHLLALDLRLRLRTRPSPRSRPPQPDLSLLRDGRHPAAQQYAAALDSRMADFGQQLLPAASEEAPATAVEQSGSTLAWDALAGAAVQTAQEVLPPRPARAPQPHVTPEMLDLAQKRREAAARGDQQEAARYKTACRRLSVKARRRHLHQLGVQMKQLYLAKCPQRWWSLVRDITAQPQRKLQLRDAAGQPLSERQQEEAVVSHFEQLLNGGGRVDAAVLAEVACQPSGEPFPPPTEEEVEAALAKLRYGKAADALGVTAELLRGGGPLFQRALHSLVCRVWEGETPSALVQAEMSAVLKPKGDPGQLKSLRPITIISLLRKLVARILCARLTAWLEEEGQERLLEAQCGFRPGRSCADQLFSMRRLEESALEWGQPMHVCAFDLKAAFDSVPREGLWALAQAAGMPGAALSLLQRMYDGTACCLRLGGGRKSRSFDVRCGVQQGCPASNPLFNIFINRVLAETLQASEGCGVRIQYRLNGHLHQQRLKAGSAISTHLVSALMLADDIMLVADSHAQLQTLADALHCACQRWQLRINTAKTHHLVVLPRSAAVQSELAAQEQPALTLGGEPVGRVQKLEYLGSTFCESGSIDADISARLSKAGFAFHQLGRVWRLRSVPLATKMEIFRYSVLATLLYGSHAWAPTQQQEDQLHAFYMRSLRSLLGVTLRDHLRNEEVLRRCNAQPMGALLRQERLRWLGHSLRMPDERLPKQLLWAQRPGMRPRGRPPRRWREDTASEDVRSMGLASSWQRVAQHRAAWHQATKGMKVNPRALLG